MSIFKKFLSSAAAVLTALTVPAQTRFTSYAADIDELLTDAAYSLGDLNGDGLVDASDASAILIAYSRLSTGGDSGLTASQEYAANVNGDKTINASDASDVLQYYAYVSTGGTRNIESFLKDKNDPPAVQPTTTSVPVTTAAATAPVTTTVTTAYVPEMSVSFDLNSIPTYTGSPYTVVNDNVPYFKDFTTEVFEEYSPLDSLGRCGTAFANVCIEIMPTEPRGEIGSVKPSGWHSVRYDGVDGNYLFNRCHLIGWQLAGENANNRNLITGTRYMNVDGMLPFENMIDDYVDETRNHVMYRVTPVFVETELVARGVLMEAYSVEDSGGGIEFNVFCYNVQPTIVIDYATGESYQITAEPTEPPQKVFDYVLNTNTKKFHYPDCGSVSQMSEKNKGYFTGTRDEAIAMGYSPCGNCKP